MTMAIQRSTKSDRIDHRIRTRSNTLNGIFGGRWIRSTLLCLWLTLGLLGFTKSSFASTVKAQPTQLIFSLTVPSTVPADVLFNEPMTATANGITGCYRWVATGLPRGLVIKPKITCATSGASITSEITGIPANPIGASFATKITVTIEAVGPSASSPAASGPTAATASETILVIPPKWGTSNAANAYANTGLSLVSCVQGPSCWTVGISKNTVPVPHQTQNKTISGSSSTSPSITGTAPIYVPLTIPKSKKPIGTIEGGVFVASIEQVTPLRLGVVRTGIPLSISAISCPTMSTCVFVGSKTSSSNLTSPVALLMTNSGANWTAISLPLSNRYNGGSLTAITCPNIANCIATGNANGLNSQSSAFTVPLTIFTTGNESKLKVGNINYLSSQSNLLADISCSNATDCIAVGRATGQSGVTQSAIILATTNSGATWHRDQQVGAEGPNPGPHANTALQPWMSTVDGPLEFGGLTGVGCAPGTTTSSCEVSWPFWPALANTNNGTNWYPDVSSQGTSGIMNGNISCPVSGHCFGVSTKQFMCAYDMVCTSTQILETIPNTSNWEVGLAGQGPNPKFGPALNSISCPTVTTCVAVGGWFPLSASSWSPEFPLVMSPQLAAHPFFLPPPPPPTLFTWTNAGILLGVVSLATGVGEFTDLLGGSVSLVTGLAGLGIGAATTSQGDMLGWLSVLLGGLGVFFYTASVASTVTGIADVPYGVSGPTPGFSLPKTLQNTPTPNSTGEGLLPPETPGGPSE